jgi:thioredoxin reductase (NADPH)
MSDNPVVDLVIIGAGPVGLFGAFYAGLRQMSVKIVDSLDQPGGQLAALYPEKYIYDVAGFPKVMAKDLVRSLCEQGLQYGAIPCLGEQVRELTFDESTRVYNLTTSRGAHLAKAIMICAGIGAFSPKKLPIPDLDEFVGNGIFYTVKRIADFAGKRILIVGGGDSAVDWANALAPVASELTLIHRRDGFRAHEDSVAKMRASRTRILTFHELGGVDADTRIKRAMVFDNRTKAEQIIDVDAILVNIGFESSLGPIAKWGLHVERQSILVDSTMRTNRDGIYAAGDVVSYPGKLKLIATGFGEAAIAANNIKHYIDPKARVFPGHSTDLVK